MQSALEQIKKFINISDFFKVSPAISRCPGRLSYSKHADYINSDLLYATDNRCVAVACELEKSASTKLILKNSIQEMPDCELELSQDIHKDDWSFYPIEVLKELDQQFDIFSEQQKIKTYISSDLPPASGLSSSHALMLACLRTYSAVFELDELNICFAAIQNLSPKCLSKELTKNTSLNETAKAILKLCQRVENKRGFQSGLGDQAAQLFGKEGYFVYIKLEPSLKVSYRKIPDNLSLMTAASLIKVDKSKLEFAEANANIQRYAEVNQSIEGFDYLADVLAKGEKYAKIELGKIEDEQLQSLALYGLAEATRIKKLQSITDDNEFCMALGSHLNKSHNAESTMGDKLKPDKALSDHFGYYGASTRQNDELQALAIELNCVFGSSISGAGLGGNNNILCHKGKEAEVYKKLKAYYKDDSKAKSAIHLSCSSPGLELKDTLK